MKITVTKAHINQGQRHKTDFCPVALALRACLKRPVSVGCFSFSDGSTGFRLPSQATSFIEAFDAGKPVKPFNFTVPGLK